MGRWVPSQTQSPQQRRCPSVCSVWCLNESGHRVSVCSPLLVWTFLFGCCLLLFSGSEFSDALISFVADQTQELDGAQLRPLRSTCCSHFVRISLRKTAPGCLYASSPWSLLCLCPCPCHCRAGACCLSLLGLTYGYL